MSEKHHHNVSGKNLFITIVLNIIITLSQIVVGIISGTLRFQCRKHKLTVF